MSNPTLISPLLDGFIMGSPIADQTGSICCPALKENSEKKYIVKIISVPASQVQMDALLLAGAYKDPADAMDYFQDVAQGLVAEAELLQKLSAEHGFAAFEGCQLVPITRRRLGYYVYLLGTYKRSLEKHIRRHPVTHLEAVNLGLDLCSALSACRQAGYLYVNLKPTNIYVTEDKRYRIGDLGFLDRNELSYTALPDRYRSDYSPPELADPMNSVDETTDTYALGMILYQLYNDGHLPVRVDKEDLPSPVNADYEIAEIILKAISEEPALRWQSPDFMRQALVSYMQRNTVNNTPITPYTPLDVEPETSPEQPETEPQPESGAQAPEQAPVEASTEETNEAAEDATQTEEPQDDTAPAERDGASLLPHQMSEEASEILDQVDELIAHAVPEDAAKLNKTEDPFAFAQVEEQEVVDDLPPPTEADMADAEEEKRRQKQAKRQKRLKRAISIVSTALVVIILAGAVGWAYQSLYLKKINGLTITGGQNSLVVKVDTTADDRLLTVVCSDNHGTSQKMQLENGQAVFTDLVPDTLYKIRLEVSGYHKLVGQTSDIFTTDSATKILRFSAVTGTEDGSVVLNFTPTGGEIEEWVVKYDADGEEERMQIFSGNSVTISGLTLGKRYTFTLEPNAEASLSGETTLEYMATRLVLAENLMVSTSDGSNMTVTWEAPGDIVVSSWDVRCYSDTGYEQQTTVTDTTVTFEGIDPSFAYTIEVVAAGMTEPARTSITANPINITGVFVDESDPEQMTVTWEHSGTAPEGGWLLMYTIDGSEVPNVIKCDSATAVVSPRVPNAKYQFTIQATDSTSIFGNVYSHISEGAAVFESNGLSAEKIEAHMVVTPEKETWTYDSIGKEAFTSTVAVGDKLSVVLHGTESFYLAKQELRILYVFRDAFGNVLPDLIGQDTGDWKKLWLAGDYHYGELNVPTAPTAPGDYSLSIYFNGKAVTVLNFSVN